jgi:hypothetical protein
MVPGPSRCAQVRDSVDSVLGWTTDAEDEEAGAAPKPKTDSGSPKFQWCVRVVLRVVPSSSG